REGRLCFALALWNGRDPILKERLFGLTNAQGNHGEDVKECYFYLDATPTHSYCKALYKYPQAEFPYQRLVEANQRRGRNDPEFELADTGAFDDNRYFDVFAEYAKNSPNDTLIRFTVTNRGSNAVSLDALPKLWFRNTWAWGRSGEGYWPKPRIVRAEGDALLAEHFSLGHFHLACAPGSDGSALEWLFTDNETNTQKLFGAPNTNPFVKDAFHEFVVHSRKEAVNPAGVGTKAAAHYRFKIQAGQTVTLRLRLFASEERPTECFGTSFEEVFAERIREADGFYSDHIPARLPDEEQRVARQAYAGLL